MMMFDKLKNLFKKPEPVKVEEPKAKKEKQPRKKKEEVNLSPKELATQNNEPYIGIVHVQIDPADVNNGMFELDWNDKFVLNLIRAGYKIRDDDTEQQIVDRWFQTVCRNIALEIYEQQQADPDNRDLRVIRSRDIGNGRTEVS
jgi:hypothetical protein